MKIFSVRITRPYGNGVIIVSAPNIEAARGLAEHRLYQANDWYSLFEIESILELEMPDDPAGAVLDIDAHSE